MNAKQQKLAKLLAKENLSSLQLSQRTGISQPTVSRALKDLPVIKIGAGRISRFALIEPDKSHPLFKVSEQGELNQIATLYVQPNQRCILKSEHTTEAYSQLPYFLTDLLPRGYLGEKWLQAEGLEANEPDQWSLMQQIEFLTEYGADLPGNLVLGKKAAIKSLTLENKTLRESEYPFWLQGVVNAERVVGYLGGDRPKFTAFTGMDHVLIKFSPKLDSKDAQALRYKDLLVCEQIALQTLSQAGLVVAQAKLVQSDRLYLQFKRFDRVNGKGRKGVLTLAALQQAYGLDFALSWPLVADQLYQLNVISDENRQVLHFVYAFAQLIGHEKMDARNVAFYFEEGKVLGLAPIYDVWPSRLWSESGETSKSDWTPPLLFDVEPRIAQQAKDLASYYYKRIFENYLVSYETKKRFNGL